MYQKYKSRKHRIELAINKNKPIMKRVSTFINLKYDILVTVEFANIEGIPLYFYVIDELSLYQLNKETNNVEVKIDNKIIIKELKLITPIDNIEIEIRFNG